MRFSWPCLNENQNIHQITLGKTRMLKKGNKQTCIDIIKYSSHGHYSLPRTFDCQTPNNIRHISFGKKESPGKTMQKRKKKLTNLPHGCSFVDHLIRGKTTNNQKYWPLWTTNQQHHPKTCKSNQTYRSPNNIPNDQKETIGSMHETKTHVVVKKSTEKKTKMGKL